jgi:hypothetical protein
VRSWGFRFKIQRRSTNTEGKGASAESAAVVLGNTALRVCWPLYAYRTGRRPPGCLVLMDTTGGGIDPGPDDLGGRCKRIYFRAEALGLPTG